MSVNIINILIVDDHPMIIYAYKNLLQRIFLNDKKVNFNIDSANTIDQTINKIYFKDKNFYNIIILDIKLRPSEDKKLLSGEDLGIKIRIDFKKIKIIISTTLNDNYRISSIMKSVNPDAFLVKNDISPKHLLEAIKCTLCNKPYYSSTILDFMKKRINNDFLLDNLDRRLLYELSLGAKTKDLIDVLPLSIGGIERRKRKLKKNFNLKTNNDRELIFIAKEKGYI
tara:strand:+ start:2318 stop:2995 length:678 start_codon:yes stop_codon:yes gene_type:complete